MSQFTKRVVETNDDGSLYTPDSSWSTYNFRLGSNTKPAFRFTNVTVPKDATITSAYIKLVAFDYAPSAVIKDKIYGIAEDNTGSMSANPTGRTKTTSVIDWDINGIVDDVEYTSPDIKTLVQEIVNRAGWSSGNALGFIFENNGSNDLYFFYDYEDNSSFAAYIEINYTTGSPSSSISPSISPSASLSPSSSPSPSSTPSPSLSPSSSISPSASLSPSSSISSSSSRSLSPSASASASPSPENYGLFIKKSTVNKNVQEITDPKEYAFTSALGVLGLREIVEITDTTDANGQITKTVAHGIGYPCITKVKFTAYDNAVVQLPIEWRSNYSDILKGEIEVTEVGDFKINGTNIVITMTASESDNIQDGYFAYLSNRLYTFKVYYYFNEIVETA